MKFKVGDKVRFMDEQGGGIVSKILSSMMVNIATEDGFEIPYLARDIVKIEAESHSEKSFDVDYNVPAEVFNAETHREQMDFRKEPLFLTSTEKRPELQGVFLAYVPVDQKMLISGPIHFEIYNTYQEAIQFRLVLQNENGFKELVNAKMDAFSKFYIDELDSENIEGFLKGHVQMIFMQENSDRLLSPISAEFKIKGSKFYKENSYKTLPFIKKSAIVYELVKINEVPVLQRTHAVVNKEEVPNVQVKAAAKRQRDHILQHQIRDGFAEVDMHIWELVENHERMSNSEMQVVQMDYFSKCLESAMEHRFDTVVFIHGVGSGKLKQEVREELTNYDNLEFKDASLAEYGVGATKVEFFYGKG